MMELDQQFWSERYKDESTGWDIGYASDPLKEYIDQLEDTSVRILIPGAGNSYEAEYLFKKGFEDVTVVDIAQEPLDNLQKRVPEFPEEKLVRQDFFEHKGEYDLVLEQTFFCALDPQLRGDYIRHMKKLLKPGGKLVGVLFDFPLSQDGPPFGGRKEEYLRRFEPYFEVVTLERCYNSIKPRQGSELFLIARNP